VRASFSLHDWLLANHLLGQRPGLSHHRRQLAFCGLLHSAVLCGGGATLVRFGNGTLQSARLNLSVALESLAIASRPEENLTHTSCHRHALLTRSPNIRDWLVARISGAKTPKRRGHPKVIQSACQVSDSQGTYRPVKEAPDLSDGRTLKISHPRHRYSHLDI
jgi:hypothetical protein